MSLSKQYSINGLRFRFGDAEAFVPTIVDKNILKGVFCNAQIFEKSLPVEPVVCVPRVGVRIIAAEIVAGSSVLQKKNEFNFNFF